MNKTKLLKVLCPYCTVGHAMVGVEKRHGADHVDKRARQCEACKRYFDLKIEFHVSGIPLEPVDAQAALRKSLQEML